MNTDKLIIRGNDVREYIDLMTKCLNEYMMIIKTMDSYKRELIWQSPNQIKALEKYNLMIKEYLSFANKIMKFIEFLTEYTNGYSEILTKIKRDYEIMNDKYKEV